MSELPILTQVINTPAMPAATIVGRYMIQHYRNRVSEVGADRVFKQLQKQGIPRIVANVIIYGRV